MLASLKTNQAIRARHDVICAHAPLYTFALAPGAIHQSRKEERSESGQWLWQTSRESKQSSRQERPESRARHWQLGRPKEREQLRLGISAGREFGEGENARTPIRRGGDPTVGLGC